MRISHSYDSAVCIEICALGVLTVANFLRLSSAAPGVALLVLMTAWPAPQAQLTSRTIPLPTSKELAEPAPGSPQMLNSLPMTAAISPDGRYLAVVNAGYGTFESRYQQSIAVLDIKAGTVTDFPEPRTASSLPQTLYSGLAFGKDGTHLYAVFDSLTAPEGNGKDETGNDIAVYNLCN